MAKAISVPQPIKKTGVVLTTWLKFRSRVRRGMKSTKLSMTVPSRTMTLRQISQRFAAGMTDLETRIGLYDEGKTVVKNFHQLDYTDKAALIATAEAQINEWKNKRQLEGKQRHEDQIALLVKQGVEKHIAEQKAKTAVTDGKNS